MYFVRLAICVVLCATLAASRLLILEDDAYIVALEITGVGENATISLVLTAYTTGAIGFGFGLSDELPGTDVFLGGLDNTMQTPYIDDYYIMQENVRVKDQCTGCQNWNLVSATESNGYTFITVKRLLKTNDTQWDVDINNMNLYVRWTTAGTDNVEGVSLNWKSRMVNLFTVDDTPSTTTLRPTTGPTTTTTEGPTTTTTTEGPKTRHLYLDDKYTVELAITGSGVNGVIELLLKVNTTGFVGFGLSSNPNMTGADLFIGGFDAADNSLYGIDCHGNGNEMPIEDKNGQDWIIFSGSEEEGITTLQINRALDTNSPDEDMAIKDSDLYVIWSYGENDTISQHVAQGSRRLNLFVVDDSVSATTRNPGSGSGSGSSTLRTSFVLVVMVAFALWK